MKVIREVRGSSRFKDSETKRRRVINSLTDRKPSQALKERGDMIKFGITEEKSSSMVLNVLEFLKEAFWRPCEQSIQVICT